MSGWQRISIILFGLLVLTCLTVAGVGAWWVTNSGASNALAAIASLKATGTPVQETPEGPAGLRLAGKGLPIVGTFGVVSAVSGSSITVQGARGATRTLTIGTATRVVVVGKTNATVADIQTGDKLLALGLRNGANLEPRAVIATPASYSRANVIFGKLESAPGRSLSLQTATGSINVVIDTDTQLYNQLLQPAQVSNLVTGSYLVVIGQPQTDGSLSGQLVLARMNAPGTGRQNRLAVTPTPTPTP